MSVFGVSPFGTELGPFGGPGLVTVLGVAAPDRGSAAVAFDRPVNVSDDGLYYSAIYAASYELAGVSDPAPLVAFVEADPDDPTQVLVRFDAEAPGGALVDLTVVGNPRGRGGEKFAGPRTWRLRVPGRGLFAPAPTTRRLAMTDLRASAEGEFAASGRDLALHDGAASLRKRLLRRLLTRPGQFPVLPSYGVGIQLKRLARSADELPGIIVEQMKLEPDVLDASAVVDVGDDGVVLVRVAVRTPAGYDAFDLSLAET